MLTLIPACWIAIPSAPAASPEVVSDDEDFYKAQSVGTSNTQLYKQAGNSIVVNVLERIFNNLFKGEIK